MYFLFLALRRSPRSWCKPGAKFGTKVFRHKAIKEPYDWSLGDVDFPYPILNQEKKTMIQDGIGSVEEAGLHLDVEAIFQSFNIKHHSVVLRT